MLVQSSTLEMPISGEASRALVGPSAAGDRKSPEACGQFLILLLFIYLLRTSGKFLKMTFKSKLHKIILHMCGTTVHTFKFPIKSKRKLGTGAGVLSPAICEAKTRQLLEPQKDGGQFGESAGLGLKITRAIPKAPLPLDHSLSSRPFLLPL